MRLLAVDDEQAVLGDLTRMLEVSEGVDHVESATSGTEALRHLNGQDAFDAVFIDLRMPDLDGLELARVLRNFASPPAIVFVTGYPDAAVEAFELRVLDYLVKPVARARLDETLRRLEAGRRSDLDDEPAAAPVPPQAPEAGDENEIVPVDSLRGAKRLIARSEILYLRAQGDYVRVVTEDGRFLYRGHLGDFARRWDPLGFVQVHRQYVVNVRRIRELRPRFNGTARLVFAGDREVPVARRKVAVLRRRLNL